jgi:Holliday junction resolvase RusA-like endonuclease
MNDPLTVTLPWPESALSPNSRDRWQKIAAVKTARSIGKCEVMRNYLLQDCHFFPELRLKISFIFHPPDHKYRDLDNMVSMCKAYADGIFEAIQNNDKQIDTIEARKKDVVKGGLVTITISEDDND